MIGWLDCASGVAGDMLLGALADVGVDVGVMQAAVDAVSPEPLRLGAERVERAGLAATRLQVGNTESTTHRTWPDVRSLLDAAPLETAVRVRAHAVFEVLARAEARVHGTEPEQVHFHEVGALDAIADVVAVCAGLHHLALTELVASPVALGGGTTRSGHGRLPVPAPAVVELLRGRPTFGGPVDVELATPTGAALLVVHATSWGAQPPMAAAAQGFGAGARDLPGHPNVTRLVLGEPADVPAGDSPLVLESNVDDLDPRLWPDVLDALLAVGASDAWLTPVLMKKGRPAHTLHVLVGVQHAEAARRVVFTHTSAIGLREHAVTKRALPRTSSAVEVDGQPVRVKYALLEGRVVNAQPEFDDVAAAAHALGLPAKAVLARAVTAAEDLA